MPSFLLAVIVSLGTLIIFATWAFFDLSYSNAARLVAWDLGLQPIPEGIDLWSNHDAGIRPRLGLFLLLAIAAATSIGLVFYKLFRGAPADRSLSHWFVAMGVVAIWLALFIWNQRIQELGCQWRLRRLVSGLQQDLPKLLAEWPAEGELPYLGKFVVDGGTLVPNAFLESFNQAAYYHAFEPVAMIDRLDDGSLNFTVLSREITYVDYRPDDRPRPLSDFTRITTRVAPHWFVDQFPVDASSAASPLQTPAP